MTKRYEVKWLAALCLGMALATPGVRLPNVMGQEAPSGTPEKVAPAPRASEKESQSGALAPPKEQPGQQAIIGAQAEGEVPAKAMPALPPLKGPKKSVAVMDFENKSGFSGEWDLGDGIAEMLTTALAETNRFVVVDREKVKKVLEEQGLALAGRTGWAVAARRGKVIPAQIGVAGDVTHFSFEKRPGGIGAQDKEAVKGVVTGVAHVAINVRMLDTTTEEVLFSERVEKKGNYAGVEGEYTGKSFAIGTDRFPQTPLAKAAQEAVSEAALKIALDLENVQWRGNIVLVEGDKIIINCGKREGIVPGQKLVVYNRGEELTDPETGEILGVEETKAGTISVAEVQEKYSIARIERGKGFRRGDAVRGFRRGDILRLE